MLSEIKKKVKKLINEVVVVCQQQQKTCLLNEFDRKLHVFFAIFFFLLKMQIYRLFCCVEMNQYFEIADLLFYFTFFKLIKCIRRSVTITQLQTITRKKQTHIM